MAKSIGDLIMEYFQAHPNENLRHGPVVDWVEEEYVKLYNKKPRDIWRQIRKFHEEGSLIKVKKGVYRYDSDSAKKVDLWDFSPKVKEEIFKRDNYKCVNCGRGLAEGIELCADHIISKDKGGDNTINNGQTLCMECNLLKKNYSRTEASKRYFIKIYEQAVSLGDEKMIRFCKHIFDVYDLNGINGHIKRPNGEK